MALLESVPNVSEGRDPAVIAAIGQAFAQSGARVLDVHSDVDHHRSVFTIVADEHDLIEALLAGIARAAELIDLRSHDGIHPRVGAADVVPIVPLERGEMERAHDVALALGRRVGEELGLPVFLYGASGGGRRPAFFRRGGPAELQRRIDDGELRAGVRPFAARPSSRRSSRRSPPAADRVQHRASRPVTSPTLRRSPQRSASRAAACAASRRSGCCCPGAGRVQVSVNVIDVDAAPLVCRGRAGEGRRRAARRRGRRQRARRIAAGDVRSPTRPCSASSGLPDDRVLERRLQGGRRLIPPRARGNPGSNEMCPAPRGPPPGRPVRSVRYVRLSGRR